MPLLKNKAMTRADAIARLQERFRKITDELNRVRTAYFDRLHGTSWRDNFRGGPMSSRALKKRIDALDRMQTEVMAELEILGAYP